MLILRAHHLLCIQGFQGKGYNEEFTQNMAQIVAQFKGEEDLEIQILTSFDDICSKCPHIEGPNCVTNSEKVSKVILMDRKVIEFLNLKENKIYSKKQLIKKLLRVTSVDLEKLCDGCSWLPHGYCKKGFKELQKLFVS